MKYQCRVCKYIYNEDKDGMFSLLNDDYKCPMCLANKSNFEVLDDTEKAAVFNYAVLVDKNNLGIEKDNSLCIDCGKCYETCRNSCGLNCLKRPMDCLSCGQCILTCPTKALKSKNRVKEVLKKLEDGKVGICYISPASRVSIGEAFGYANGAFLQGKLVALLKKFGFKYVFDTTFGADLTVMEEATELLERVKNNGLLPMFSSCCPAWVKYAKMKFPSLRGNLSTCKSPIGMQSSVIENYFIPQLNIKKDDVITVAITPCTAKKMEIKMTEFGCDEVITVSELIEWAKQMRIDFKDLVEEEFDEFYNEGSGAGMIFGYSGGVATAVLKTAYYLANNREIKDSELQFNDIKGIHNAQEIEVKLGSKTIKVAVVSQVKSLHDLLRKMEKEKIVYHFIEVMNCLGGCVGGGGQPVNLTSDYLAKRKEALKFRDETDTIRVSYKNPSIKKIYKNYLDYPGSLKAQELLHSKVKNKKNFFVKNM